MKKIILSVAAVFAFGFANAQDSNDKGRGFSQGDVYLSGTASFSNEKRGEFKTDNFTIAPGVGFFVTENLAIEGLLGYTSGTTTEFNGFDFVESKNSGIGIIAGVKYFWTPANDFSLSLGGNVSYASIKSEFGNNEFTSKVFGVNVPLGLHYFVSDSFAITSAWGGLGYSSNDNGGNGADKTSSFDINLDLSSITFGLLYKL